MRHNFTDEGNEKLETTMDKANNEDDIATLKALTDSRVTEFRIVERARIILKYLEGVSKAEIARYYHIRPNTVGKWVKRYREEGIEGLGDLPRTGTPHKYEPARTRADLLAKLAESPPKGQSVWDGPSLAEAIGISPAQVWRILKKEGISLQRQRSWCISTDPQFAQKAADVIGLYLDPPEDAIVISIDEKQTYPIVDTVCPGHEWRRRIRRLCRLHGQGEFQKTLRNLRRLLFPRRRKGKRKVPVPAVRILQERTRCGESPAMQRSNKRHRAGKLECI